MTRPDWQDMIEWLIWALIFGGIIGATLWLLVVDL